MAKSSPQTFAKRQRERRKQLKRQEKLEARLIRAEEKRRAKCEAEGIPYEPRNKWVQDEDGYYYY